MVYKKLIATLGMAAAAGSLALANPAQTNSEAANVATAEATIPKPKSHNDPILGALSDSVLTQEEIMEINKKVQEHRIDNAIRLNALEAYQNQLKMYSEIIRETDKVINSYQTELAETESKARILPSTAQNLAQQISRLTADFEAGTKRFYPGLLDKKFNIVYTAETPLSGEAEEKLKPIIVETNKLLNDFCDDESLGAVLADNPLQVRSLIIYADLSFKVNKNFPTYCQTNLKTQEERIRKQIVNQEEEKKKTIKEREESGLEEKIQTLQQAPQSGISKEIVKIFSEYAKMQQQIANYKNKNNGWGMPGNNWSGSLLAVITWNQDGNREMRDIYNVIDMRPQKDLEKFLKQTYGKKVKIEKLKNPSKTKLPLWLTIPFGVLFPIFRNFGVTYLLRGKTATGNSYSEGFLGGMGNAIIGSLLLDGVHPLVYPIRMFVTPFIFQPIRKYYRGDKDWIMANE